MAGELTFADIFEQTFEEVNGRPFTSDFSSISYKDYEDVLARRVVRAVLTSLEHIYDHSRHWRFLNRRGRILTLTADKWEYKKPTIYSVEWDSLYLTADGTAARWPVVQGSYTEWQMRERARTVVRGIPLQVIQHPDPDKWIVWPTPIGTYYLNGNTQIKAELPTAVTDTPLWDAQFHEVLVWLAVAHLERRAKTKDQIVSERNEADAHLVAEAKYNSFMRHYLGV